jgi:hypothetical protein
VVIPADVARYFLEESDRLKICREKDSLNQKLIGNLNQELSIKNEVIKSFEKDSTTYAEIISNKDSIITLKEEDVKLIKKQINKESFKVHLLTGTTSGAIVGTVVPIVGTFTGILIGGTTGTVIYLVKIVTRSKFKVK